MPDKAPCFFFSYAHNDAEGRYLDQFLEDLSADIRANTAWPRETIAFKDDQSIDLGSAWAQDLGEALRTCKAFVPLYSPSYFKSSYCPKEWGAFRQRLQAQAPDSPSNPLILPILWVRPGKWMPAEVKKLHYLHREFDEVYSQNGLRRLLNNKAKFGVQYQDFVDAFSRVLVQAVEDSELPPHDEAFDLDKLADPFAQPAPVESEVPSRDPTVVRYAVIAGSSKQLGKVRSSCEAYGRDARDWRPFLPETEHKIGPIIQSVVASQGLESMAFEPTKNLLERLSDELQDAIVTIVLDVWSLNVQSCRKLMEDYDTRQHLNCALLIPWNLDDQETRERKEELEKKLHDVFTTKLNVRPDPAAFSHDIRSPSDFKRALCRTLEVLYSRIHNSWQAREIEGDGPAHQPVLSSPVV